MAPTAKASGAIFVTVCFNRLGRLHFLPVP